MNPRRIAYVIRVFPKLSETFIANEIAEVRRRGVEVRILSLCPPADEKRHKIIEQAGLEELTSYDRGEFSSILRDFRPDILHAHFATRATAAARKLSVELNIPFTFTAHRYDIYDKPPRDFAERSAAAKAVVTVSKANLQHIVQTFGVPESKVHVVPCGVDTKRFRPGMAPSTPLIVCVARLARCKNHALLLEACARLDAAGAKFHCVLVGDGPCREEIETLRNRLKLVSSVELVGAAEHDEVLGWWQRATIAVLSSESEGMPVSLMEAGACGLPAVATGVGGVPELIVDGVTGIVTRPGNAGELAQGLEKLLTDEGLARELGRAARRRVKDRFSLRKQVESLLDIWSEMLNRGRRTVAVTVTDLFGIQHDPAMPKLRQALNQEEVQRQIGRRLPRLADDCGYVHLKEIRVVRYKPGQRCLIEYTVDVEDSLGRLERVVVIGKVRAGHSPRAAYRLLDKLWNSGFCTESTDGISVPEPIGVLDDFDMWLQRKVSGVPATDLLTGPGGTLLARRVAHAAVKLHRASIPAERRHTIADELRILHTKVPTVANGNKALAERVINILTAAERLASGIPVPAASGIHRDFYADQVIVDGERLYLVDFDLYCEGDPAVDVGNFLGHVTEQSLRTLGDPNALSHVENELEERFVELSGETSRSAVRAYKTLTLVRHIYLSTLKPERRPFTESLLDLCEERLAWPKMSPTLRLPDKSF